MIEEEEEELSLEDLDPDDPDVKERVSLFFTCCLILVKIYEGNIDKWIKWVEEEGSEDQKYELPMLREMKEDIEKDPTYLERVFSFVDEVLEEERKNANQTSDSNQNEIPTS